METKKHSSSHPAGTGRERTKTVRHGRWLLLLTTLLMLFGTSLDTRADDQADYERALASIKADHYYRIYAVVDGQKYYLDMYTYPTTSLKNARQFIFKKTTGGGEYEYGFQLVSEYDQYEGDKMAFYDQNGYHEQAEDLYQLPIVRFSVYKDRPYATQVFFLNEEGHYAIRSSNIAGLEVYWKHMLEYSDDKVYHHFGLSYDKCYEWQLEEVDTYGNACRAIEEYNYYRVFTEVNDQKYYVDANGFLTNNQADAPLFKFLKTAGEEYDYGYRLQNEGNYFTGPAGTTDDALTPGHLNTTTSTASDTWKSQVFLLDWKGRYAIRSTNAASGESGQALYGNTYWTVNTDGSSPVAGYSFTPDYQWKLEVDSAKSIPTTHVNTYVAGTTFPKFRFMLENMEGWTVVDDDVTVTYTHANGTTWTEHYPFSSLKVHLGDGANVKFYDLPFSFTEEHPEANKDQVGKTLVTAQIAMNVRDGSGQTEAVSAKATLVPQWREMALGNYYEADTYYIDAYYSSADGENVPITFTGEVMYLPRDSHHIGYKLYATDEDGNTFSFMSKTHSSSMLLFK